MTSTPEQVLPKLFAALDDHRFDALSEFYAEDVEAETVVGHLSGAAQVVGLLRSIHESIPTLQHLVSGMALDVDGDEATLRANIVAIFCDSERKPAFEGASVWRGRLRRLAGSWRIVDFSMSLVWSRGTPPAF